ncbi:DoxX family membrane protein [Bradyrhizobium sp.]|uniref:DoxX family membrane protein n=1 Tax=Bradyrhizobium sp. TaxID=376 RepID=UPI002612277F|nr:DoxX family membrane protein [Bradyrhizobium sp.]
MSTAAIAALIVRYGLVMLFLPFSALDKILGFKSAVQQAQEVFKPRMLAALVLICGLGIEVIMSLGVVTGFADRLAALIMATYCAATAVLYKRFWTRGDFWAAGDSQGRALFWDFLKNFSLGAGFLLIVIGTNGSGLRPFLAHPFASSQPYATSPEHP